MIVAVLLAAALAWWLHREGVLLPNLVRFGGSGAAALIAIRLLETGKPLLALVAGGAGATWWVLRRPKPAPVVTGEAAARQLLGVPPGADASIIRAAWRERMATAHPDKGGTAAQANEVTAARDLLLKRAR